jgi:hypothetical protein
MKKFIFILVVLMYPLSKVTALDCIPSQLDKEVVQKYDAIFMGNPIAEAELINEEKRLQQLMLYNFDVREVYKGDISGEINIIRNIYWGDRFYPDEGSWLIFANQTERGLEANLCGHTINRRIEKAREYEAILEKELQ